jgi:hypothetical protein
VVCVTVIRAIKVVASVAFVVAAAVGCAPGVGSDGHSPTPSPSCADPGPALDLGADWYDPPPTRSVQVSAGWYRLTGSEFIHGGLFDAKVGRSLVVWGLASTPPTYNPGPNTLSNTLGQADVVEGQSTWIQLPDATLWFATSNSVRLTLQACPPAAMTFVGGPSK